MKINQIKKKLMNNKGVTGIDIVVAVLVMSIFAGTVIVLMKNLYLQAVEIQKTANANAYLTIILEKADEKSYDEVTDDFVTNLIRAGEIKIGSEENSIPDEYEITFNVEPIEASGKTLKNVKKVTIKIKYYLDKDKTKSKEIVMSKLKVNEVYNPNA